MTRPGLRVRVTAAFTAGALAICASMALVSYELTRRYLLDQRERTAIRAAYLDASVVDAGLAGDSPDVVEVLRALDTGGNRRAVLRRDGEWYARNADVGVTAAIPADLQLLVEQGRPGVQRVSTEQGPAIVIGVPLSATTAFYQVDMLVELAHTLHVLALVLTLVAAITSIAGAALGWYVSRRVLRPLGLVTRAAQEITAGDLHARLDPTTEPELERLTSSFNQMVDQLARRIERDRRFAADVSHELRSPLQTLAAAASVLARRQAHLDERSGTAAGLVVEEVTRFQDLVTDLIELARTDQPPERTTVDIAELARAACCTQGIPPDIVAVTAGTNPMWRVDRRRFEQVLHNLLDNAVRHGGGPVAVRIGRCSDVDRLEVDDEGPGVHPDDRDAIFDRFVRGRSARARGDSDGTGLGLALVAEHVTAHGGRIQVVDRPGGGARFRIELPGGTP